MPVRLPILLLALTTGLVACNRDTPASSATSGTSASEPAAAAAGDAPTPRRQAVDALIDAREAEFGALFERAWALHPGTDATGSFTYDDVRMRMSDEQRAELLGGLADDTVVHQVKVALEFADEDTFPWFEFLRVRNARSSGSGRYTRIVSGHETRVHFYRTTDLDSNEEFPTAQFELRRDVEGGGHVAVDVTLRYETTE